MSEPAGSYVSVIIFAIVLGALSVLLWLWGDTNTVEKILIIASVFFCLFLLFKQRWALIGISTPWHRGLFYPDLAPADSPGGHRADFAQSGQDANRDRVSHPTRPSERRKSPFVTSSATSRQRTGSGYRHMELGVVL